MKVSTHAPVRGQSRSRDSKEPKPYRFNSCPREGAIGGAGGL